MNRSFVRRLFHDRSLRGETVAAFGGAGTMFLIQPPCDVWFFAWLAPLPWLWLITRKTSHLPQKFWLLVWCAGFISWLATIHWLRLPHLATSLGWVCLSAYLAFYLPAFIWSARLLMRRWGWPLLAAAPISWVACEQLRGSLFGGFTFGMLGHSQWRWNTLLQIADIAGAIGLSGIVMLVAAALFRLRRTWLTKETGREAVLTISILGVCIFYGHWRLTTTPDPLVAPLKALLVQGSIDTELKHDPDAFQEVTQH